jgi:Protein of unknown function (DUF4038)/Putative collagen-binding domain of a collagenase
MKQKCFKTMIALLGFMFLATAAQPRADSLDELRVSKNGRFLVREDGSGFFPIADTAWSIAWRLTRNEVEAYLHHRKDQDFNTIALIAIPAYENGNIIPNAYGDYPLETGNHGSWDPLRPIETPGRTPENSTEYDYWNHLEYIIDTADAKGMYVILLPAWGGCVAGSYVKGAPTEQVIFNDSSAYEYGHWIGQRFGGKKNLIWMMGGDRSAVYGDRDFRAVFRAMAEGVADGVNGVNQPDSQADYSTTLMSYHPRKWHPNSSEWFHNDPWLDFNSIQDQPSDQIAATELDYGLSPAKPSWLFEGGYEFRGRGGAVYLDWQIRFQAYQTVFAGAFGTTYGSMSIFHFNTGVNDLDEAVTVEGNSKWEASLDEPGASDMRHLYGLMASMTNDQYLDRIPDQALIDGDTGTLDGAEGTISSRLQATRGAKGDYAMIYSANGRNIRLNMDRLSSPMMNAFWFSPRDGNWRVQDTDFADPKPFLENIPSGPAAAIMEFDPPGDVGDGNDWVLVLKAVK